MGRIPFYLHLIVPVLAVFLVLTLTSCLYRYLGPNHPITFNFQKPCLPLKKGDLQFHAFVAIVHSLDVEKWLLISIDRARFGVVARVGGCRFPTIMNIVVDSEGIITISRSSPYRISRVHAIWIRRGMAQLEKTFLRYRCKSIKSLLEQVEKYWIKPRLLGRLGISTTYLQDPRLPAGGQTLFQSSIIPTFQSHDLEAFRPRAFRL